MHHQRAMAIGGGATAAAPRVPADVAARGSRDLVKVASVPSGHVYCRHIRPEVDEWLVLPDPTEPWWPPLMLEPEWICSNDFDVMHLHFGFDGSAPEALDRAFTVLRSSGRRLVYTAHDLRNPHHAAPGLHDEQLEVVFSHADRVVTLTPGAADEIGHRFGRTPEIIPHPYVFGSVPPAERGRDEPVVGIHLKSLRANMVEPIPIVEAAIDACTGRARLRIDVHTDIVSSHPGLIAALERHANAGRLELEVHDYFSHAEFRDYLRSLTVSVLPYRFGTHSGWLEACRDVGTRVVAPSCGYYGDQWHDAEIYQNDEQDGFAPDSLVTAIHRALERALERPQPRWRESQRADVAARHHAIYSDLAAS